MRVFLSGLLWILLYVVCCLAPLALAVGQPHTSGRTFPIELSVALGFVGLSVLALQFALVARFKVVAAPFGIDALLRYHKQISYVALAFVVAHPVILFVADSKYLSLLNLWTAPWRARFAFASVVASPGPGGAVPLAPTSRARLREMAVDPWRPRRSRRALRLAARQPGRFLRHRRRPPVVYDGYIGALICLLRLDPHPQPVAPPSPSVARPAGRCRTGNASTLVIEPVGHDGFRFDPGQFAWIAVNRSPFSHHPAPVLLLLEG